MDAKTQIVKAMAVVERERDGALLVSAYNGPDGPAFHRPLGGHVEFGEYARQTVEREFVEEIGQPVVNIRLLGVLENICQWQGKAQHEIDFLFAAAFADPAAYEISEQRIRDNDDGSTTVVWRNLGAVDPALYPDGVLELIHSHRR